MDWRLSARCRVEGTDPELFFPVSEVGPGARQTAEAKTVCASCAVTSECLSYALGVGIEFGIFGGMTPDERRNTVRSDWALAA